MALITHPTQGSYTIFHSRPQLSNRGVNFRSTVAFNLAGRTNKFVPLKYSYYWRSPLPIILQRRKNLKVSSFQGNSQNDEAEGSDRGSRLSKKTLHISYSQQEREEVLAESQDVKKHTLPFTSEDRQDSIAGSQAIQKLFKKWLILLRTEAPSPASDGVCSERSEHSAALEAHPEMHRLQARNFLKAALLHFWALDATIKYPLLIFLPCYLGVRIAYGTEVAKELTPLWLLGPLVVALYIKMIRGLCSLYVFCFKQTSKFLVSLPGYYQLVTSYIGEGKLKAYIHARFWQPMIDFMNHGYKELLIQKWKQLKEWAIEKQLDYVESIWPYYCRTIRFLKKANLI